MSAIEEGHPQSRPFSSERKGCVDEGTPTRDCRDDHTVGVLGVEQGLKCGLAQPYRVDQVADQSLRVGDNLRAQRRSTVAMRSPFVSPSAASSASSAAASTTPASAPRTRRRRCRGGCSWTRRR